MYSIRGIVVITFIFSTMVLSQDPPYKFSGLMFGDYYWIESHHDSAIVGSNGFWFRRIYFTYEHEINETFSTRMRLEMASAGDFISTSVALIPFIKDAYLKWNVNNNNQILLGISQPPTLTVIEKIWGYRFVEKTPLDLQRWAPSRDFGIALSGNLKAGQNLKYHFMLANGSGNKSEVNKGKKILISLGYYLTENIILEVYGDWNDNPGSTDFFTYQGFAGYTSDRVRIGLQYAHQTRKVEQNSDEQLDLASVFLILKFSKKMVLITRYDRMFAPNSLAVDQQYIPFDPTAKSTLFIAGVDYSPLKNINFTPNIEIVYYDKNVERKRPDTDIIPRLTFYYKFE